jgi:hypothetical protein
VNVWPFIEAEEAGQHSIERACALLEVSRAAFYEHRKHQPSLRELSDVERIERIGEHPRHDSEGTYGSPRVHLELRDQGVHVGKNHGQFARDHGGVVHDPPPKPTRTPSLGGMPVRWPLPSSPRVGSLVS